MGEDREFVPLGSALGYSNYSDSLYLRSELCHFQPILLSRNFELLQRHFRRILPVNLASKPIFLHFDSSSDLQRLLDLDNHLHWPDDSKSTSRPFI